MLARTRGGTEIKLKASLDRLRGRKEAVRSFQAMVHPLISIQPFRQTVFISNSVGLPCIYAVFALELNPTGENHSQHLPTKSRDQHRQQKPTGKSSAKAKLWSE